MSTSPITRMHALAARLRGSLDAGGGMPDDAVHELLASVHIVDVIHPHVPLKKVGREYRARCPFHDEASPSFTVSPMQQIYHCFGCGAHGTALRFLIEFHKSTPEAAVIALLAAAFGAPLGDAEAAWAAAAGAPLPVAVLLPTLLPGQISNTFRAAAETYLACADTRTLAGDQAHDALQALIAASPLPVRDALRRQSMAAFSTGAGTPAQHGRSPAEELEPTIRAVLSPHFDYATTQPFHRPADAAHLH